MARAAMARGQIIADALRRFADEHGVPNRVSPGELSAHYVNLTPLEIGLSAWDATLRLNDAGYHVTYGQRLFHLRGEG